MLVKECYILLIDYNYRKIEESTPLRGVVVRGSQINMNILNNLNLLSTNQYTHHKSENLINSTVL